jgi:hypothetical protein
LLPFDTGFCGELGIRTPGTGKGSTVFKTAAIDHSASSPGAKVQIRADMANFFSELYVLSSKMKEILFAAI